MYVRRLRLLGFKTLAKKTVLEFAPPKGGRFPITMIVGPNGSGKSNIADAIRWCLGEQSLKAVRGKTGEDVIFSGGVGAARSGVAEVGLTFVNDEGKMGEAAEVEIVRRVYRDGEANYLLNGETVRLQDLQLLLTEAGVAHRSYSVIGQGQVDQVLLASPEERKVFFDEATGVRGLLLQRNQAVNKLARAEENVLEGQRILAELLPRFRLLQRAMERLARREAVEAEFLRVAGEYVGVRRAEVEARLAAAQARVKGCTGAVDEAEVAYAAADVTLGEIIAAAASAQVDTSYLAELKAVQEQLLQAERVLATAKQAVAVFVAQAQHATAPIALTQVIAALDEWLAHAESGKELSALIEQIRALRDACVGPKKDVQVPEELRTAVEVAEAALKEAEARVRETEAQVKAREATQAQPSGGKEAQEQLRLSQRALREAEDALGSAKIALAHAEEGVTRLNEEIRDLLTPAEQGRLVPGVGASVQNVEALRAQLMRIRKDREAIGEIDASTAAEHLEVSERVQFYEGHLEDLQSGITQTKQVIARLDGEIAERGETAFAALAASFSEAFVRLFGGGSARLKLRPEETIDGEVQPAGVDIEATPPGKVMKSLALLSGGERALTALALLLAILDTRPSPFVVLDEVDAALDEANTRRFAEILSEMAHKTQFIVITHNRATMEVGDLLYGVTMGEDGTSRLLSLTLEDYAKDTTARR